MDLAKRLGVEDLDAPLMLGARTSWRRWCVEDSALGVVADLDELPEWTRSAPRPTKDDVLVRLAARTATKQDAVTALAWLLVPGATRIAVELRDRHPDIDGIVAGQLWLEASRAHELTGSSVATRGAPWGKEWHRGGKSVHTRPPLTCGNRDLRGGF